MKEQVLLSLKFGYDLVTTYWYISIPIALIVTWFMITKVIFVDTIDK